MLLTKVEQHTILYYILLLLYTWHGVCEGSQAVEVLEEDLVDETTAAGNIDRRNVLYLFRGSDLAGEGVQHDEPEEHEEDLHQSTLVHTYIHTYIQYIHTVHTYMYYTVNSDAMKL